MPEPWTSTACVSSTLEAFLDEKSGGFQLQASELSPPEALERLLLIVAIATLHLTSLGVGVVQAGKRRWVDTHWDRGLSYLKLGWRWRQQQYQRGWQTFVPFWLDPEPDPLPVPARAPELFSEGRKTLSSQLLCKLSVF